MPNFTDKPYLVLHMGDGALGLFHIESAAERLPGEPGMFELTVKNLDDGCSTTIRSDDTGIVFAESADRSKAALARTMARAVWASHQRTIEALRNALRVAEGNQWTEFKAVAGYIADYKL